MLPTSKMKFCLAFLVFLVSVCWTASAQQRAPNRNQVKQAERKLADLGYWTGAIDGVFDRVTRSAVVAFQKWEGRPITGELTRDELEAIRDSTAPKARETGYGHVEVDVDRQVLLVVNDDGGIKILPVSTGSEKDFREEGETSFAHTPRGRFIVYDKVHGWDGRPGGMYYSNYISGGVAIHGYPSVPNEPASHGCIRIPLFAAREVSKLTPMGTIVLVYDKISFVSAKSWAENPQLKQAALAASIAAGFEDSAYPTGNVTRTKSFVIKKARPRMVRA